MPPLTELARARAVAAAMACDLNSELTIIASAAALLRPALDTGSRLLLIEIERAADRCAWKAASVQQFAKSPARAPVEALLPNEG